MNNTVKKPRRVLVVEDDPDFINLYRKWLACDGSANYDIVSALGYASGLEAYQKHLGLFDVVILDLQLAGEDPNTFKVKRQPPRAADGWRQDVEASVCLAEAFRREYLHIYPPRLIVTSKYVDKMIVDFETTLRLKFHAELKKETSEAAQMRFIQCIRRQCEELDREMLQTLEHNQMYSLLPRLPYLTCDKELLKSIREKIDVVETLVREAHPDKRERELANLLILGASGTGKTHLARAIHNCWPRWNRPFNSVNLAGLTPTLFAAELFGVAVGGAQDLKGRPGLVMRSGSGTLFLDELTNVSPDCLRQLLDFLSTRRIAVVGSRVESDELPTANLYLILAAQQGAGAEDLQKSVGRRGSFSITVPPLNQRKADIQHVIDYITQAITIERGWRIKFDEDATRVLQAQSWPSHMAGLTSVLAEAILLARKERRTLIGSADLRFPDIKDPVHSEPIHVVPPTPLPTPSAPTPTDSMRSILSHLQAQFFRDAINAHWQVENGKKTTELVETILLVQLAREVADSGGRPNIEDIGKRLGVNAKTIGRWVDVRLSNDARTRWFPGRKKSSSRTPKSRKLPKAKEESLQASDGESS